MIEPIQVTIAAQSVSAFSVTDPDTWTLDWGALTVAAIAVAIGIGLAYLAYLAVFALVNRLTKMSAAAEDNVLIERIRKPIKWSFIAIGITLAAQADENLRAVWEPLGQFLRPALLGWIAYNIVQGFTAAMELSTEAHEDPVAMRSRKTRIAVLSRIATTAIIVITIGLMLFAVPSVRSIGTTMLASAGLAALAVGAAAQPALKSLISGLQVALTEPMRIGDLVDIDGEVGRVEEMRMSFVTVRTWDERIVIVPTSRFLEGSFENWSRSNERLTGPVFLHLDPASHVQPMREEFERYLEAHELFDGRNSAFLMTEAYPESIAIRMSMSAATIGELWALRCATREHMIAWIRDNQPDALIRHRLEAPGGHPKAGEPDAP